MLKLDVLAAELNLWANETEQIYRATKEIKYRGDAKHLRYLAATLNQSSLPSTGVTSFNTRVGDVVLSSLDVTTALGYNPVTEARTLTINGVTYDLSANRSWTISTATPTLAQVTTAGNTTTNAITVGGLTVATNLIYTDTVNGRVGIGTLTPSAKVDIRSSGINTEVLHLVNSAGGTLMKVFNGGSGQSLVFIGSEILLRSDAALSYINAGNFAIGTTTDSGYKLDVVGTARVQGNLTLGDGTTLSNKDIILVSNRFVRLQDSGFNLTNWYGNSLVFRHTFGFNANSLFEMRYDSSFHVGLTGINQFSLSLRTTASESQVEGYRTAFNTNVKPLRLFTSDPFATASQTLSAGDIFIQTGTGVNGGNTGRIVFQIGNSTNNTAQFSTAGNFLINTTTDAGYKLDVNGTARVQGNLNVGGVINTAATYTNCGLNAPVNVTTNGTVIIGFTAKLDPNGWWNPGTKKWIPTIPGYYYVALQVRWDIGTLGNQINIQILQNTNTVAIAQDLLPTNTGLTQTTNAILYMNGSTDYLEFSGFTSSTSGEFIFGEPAGNWTFFNAFRIN